MANVIVIAVIVMIVGGATIYIIREKKRGVKCIGCPAGGNCPGKGKCTSNHE